MRYFTFLLLLLCTDTFSMLSAQSWTIVPVGEGAKPSIAVDDRGTPHIAYMLEAVPGYVRHAVLQADTFHSQLVAEAYYYGPLDIGIDPTGRPHIVVHNHDHEDQNHFYPNDAGNWVIDRIEHPGHDGWDNSIAFDSQGLPHTSSVDPSQFGGDGVEYAYYDGAQWTVEPIQSGMVKYANATSIQIDSDDRPHVAFYDDMEGDLMYALKRGDSWMITRVDTEGAVGRFPSLLLDEQDRPHIAYYNQIVGDQGAIRYAVRGESGWSFTDVDTLDAVVLGFSGARRVTALAMDSGGALHLAYGDRAVVRYARLLDNQWERETVVDVRAEPTVLGAQVDLDVSADGQPHLTYFEVERSSPLSGPVRYATRELSTSLSFTARQNLPLTAYPNPAGDRIWLQYHLPVGESGQLQILDLRGKIWLSNPLPIESRQISIDVHRLPLGVYFVQISSGGDYGVMRMVIGN